MDETNPKDRIGVAKPQLNLLPAAALLHEAEAMRNGAEKYGAANWRTKAVKASIYVAAAMRHILQWYDDQEENAEDSGVHHLGHARACLGILLDAQAVGNLVDDRPIPGAATKVINRLTKKPEPKGFEPIQFSLKPGDEVVLHGDGSVEFFGRLDPIEEAAVQAEGFSDAERRPEYVHAGPFGEPRSVEDGAPGYVRDRTLAAARFGKDAALSAYRRQYGTGA